MSYIEEDFLWQELEKIYWILKISLTVQLYQMNKTIEILNIINKVPLEKRIKLERRVLQLEKEVEKRKNLNDKMNKRAKAVKNTLEKMKKATKRRQKKVC